MRNRSLMSERRTLGQILTGLGRISEDDVAKALEYQRDHGGYFGEALLACGLVTENELDFGLASQFDLPYAFPEADSVDPEAVALVSPEWALRHLALPILKTETALKVILDSPMNTAAVDDLHARTNLEIEVALASASTIRELIRQVYARGTAADEEEVGSPLRLVDAFDAVLRSAAQRFGVSSRSGRAWVWWEDAGVVRRRPLAGDWRAELERDLKPGPRSGVKGRTRATWQAELTRSGVDSPVEVRYLADDSGLEYLFRPLPGPSEVHERFQAPPPGIVSEIRLLARSGAARFVVTAEPDGLGHEILPHLPHLLLDPSWRGIHVHADEHRSDAGAFSLAMPKDPRAWRHELETLRAFHFDVVTVDLEGGRGDWTDTALDVASIAFLLWPRDEDKRAAMEAGVRWQLHVSKESDERLEWSLEPLHG
jgi:hypothetical protein